MKWPEILLYKIIIIKIAAKYANDADLAEDVVQEVMLRLYEDKRLDTSKFDPKKKDAAIRNTIRNTVLNVLRSRKSGRWQFESLDKMQEQGFQIDSDERVFNPDIVDRKAWVEEQNETLTSDNNVPPTEETK